MIRAATEDTTIEIHERQEANDTRTKRLPVQKGQQVIIDMVGVREYSILFLCIPYVQLDLITLPSVDYNPRYFPEPETFKPSRWHDVITTSGPDTEIFSAFSVGQRACLGRRFATAEALAFLSMFLRDWKVLPQRKGGVKEERKANQELQAEILLTLGVENVGIELVRR